MYHNIKKRTKWRTRTRCATPFYIDLFYLKSIRFRCDKSEFILSPSYH